MTGFRPSDKPDRDVNCRAQRAARRAGVCAAAMIVAWAASSSLGWPGRAVGEQPLPTAVATLMRQPRFKHAHWGMLVADLKSGDVIYELDADKLFAPASTTKLYSTAAALFYLGADYRFQTPIYRRGKVDARGMLEGDLILVASGDLTMGGRTGPDGRIAFGNHDHTYANSNSTTDLTEPDPLAGLDELARQVKQSGIRRVNGDVLIDTRLFEPAASSGSGPTRVTPILINDNVIDFTITPSTEGSPAVVSWRPRGSFFEVESGVKTVGRGEETRIDTEPAGENRLAVGGQIAADHPPVTRIHEVPHPADWARAWLIEALKRADIEIGASPGEPNQLEDLPEAVEYAASARVALLESPRLAENIRLILKVSHNLHASTLPLLVATHKGKRTLNDGLRLQHDFLKEAGVEVEGISFGGGAGGASADFTSPRATVQLLRYMAGQPDFAVYEDALPVLGVDGTLADAVNEKSPARGKVKAKTGTLYWYNAMNDRYLLTSKALAGYLEAKSGRRVAFAVFVNGVHLDRLDERNAIGGALGQICETLQAEL